MQQYPSWRFHKDGSRRVIESPAEEAEGWLDSPVRHLEPAPDPDPAPVADAPDELDEPRAAKPRRRR